MAAYDSVSQNLKFFNVAERSPIRRALVSLSVGTIRRYQDVGNTAARLRPVTHSQRMQSDFQRFSIYKLDAHSLADVFLVQSAWLPALAIPSTRQMPRRVRGCRRNGRQSPRRRP